MGSGIINPTGTAMLEALLPTENNVEENLENKAFTTPFKTGKFLTKDSL